MVAIAVGSIFFNFPRFIDDYAVTSSDGQKATLTSTVIGASNDYQIIYSGIFYYVVIYAVPMIALVFMTQRLITSIRKFYARREQMTSVGRVEHDLTITLVFVVVVFMVCQIGNPIFLFPDLCALFVADSRTIVFNMVSVWSPGSCGFCVVLWSL